MASWLGQYCIYVSDLDRTVRFYETLGLTVTSRTGLGHIDEAIVECPGKGGKLQLAQKLDDPAPIRMGNALWKLYIATNDIEGMHSAAVEAGYTSESPPQRLDRWPMSVGFLRDPDGYLVELTQRHPWRDGDTTTPAWLSQYCIYVSDIDRTRSLYETLGLQCTSQTDIPGAREVIIENPAAGGKMQLAQRLEDPAPIDMGTAMWKLYVNTDDCEELHRAALGAGFAEVNPPSRLDRWPVTVSFLSDPDGYLVELVERHPDG